MLQSALVRSGVGSELRLTPVDETGAGGFHFCLSPFAFPLFQVSAMSRSSHWFTWKRLLGMGGGLGRGILPYFVVVAGVGVGGMGLLAAALTAAEDRARSMGQGLLLAGGSLLVTALLLDVALRLTDPPPVYRPELYTNHEALGYFFSPNQRYESNSPDDEFKAVFYTDADGLIIRDGSNEPRPDATRILFLGDSILRGIEVAADENLSVLAARQLEAALGRDVQPINLGVSGYSPTHYLIAYRTFRQRFDPQAVVVLVYVGNDFTEDARMVLDDRVILDDAGQPIAIRPMKDYERGLIWTNQAGLLPFEEVRPTLVPAEIWHRGLLPTLNRLVLVPLCRRLELGAFQPAQFDPADLPDLPVDEGGDLACRDMSGDLTPACIHYPLRDQTLLRNNYDGIFKETFTDLDRQDLEYGLNALRRLAAEVRANGRDLLIVVVPASNQIPGQGIGIKGLRGLRPDEVIESTTPQRLMREFCAAESLDCIDLLPIFLDHAGEPLYWVFDAHLAPRGHAIIAGAIAEYLLNVGGQ